MPQLIEIAAVIVVALLACQFLAYIRDRPLRAQQKLDSTRVNKHLFEFNPLLRSGRAVSVKIMLTIAKQHDQPGYMAWFSNQFDTYIFKLFSDKAVPMDSDEIAQAIKPMIDEDMKTAGISWQAAIVVYGQDIPQSDPSPRGVIIGRAKSTFS